MNIVYLLNEGLMERTSPEEFYRSPREERTRQDARKDAVARLQAKLRGYGKKLPRQLELGSFMNELTQVGQQSSLRNFTVMPGGAKRLELFFEQPISLNFEGDFMHAALFLRQIEDLQRITRVRRVHMRSRDEKTGLVEVELTMNIYFSEI